MVYADLILHGAPILTQDPDQPEADSVAFRNGRVLAVGPTNQTNNLNGPATNLIELASDQLVLPGFVDCHTHAARLGEMHWRQDLSGAQSKDQALTHLEQIAERTPKNGWVIGFDWDETQWDPSTPITQADLDDVSTQHKVLARRICGHRTIVNTPALETLDVDPDTPGAHETPDGTLSGELSEDAAAQAWETCAPAYETCIRGLREETQRLLSLGITTIADTANQREIRLLTNGARQGFVKQRSHLYVHEDLAPALETLQLGPIQGPTCSLLGIKTYTDGSIGARTAALHDPYQDDDTTGMLLRDADDVQSLAERAQTLGLQLKAHAIGDRAIDATLDGIDAANLAGDARPRIEHAEMITPEQIQRAAELGVTLVMQPNFIANWQHADGLYETALGPKRTQAMNPLRSVHESQTPLAFSSDGMPYGPLYGIQSAVHHPNPTEQLRLEDAFTAYTRGAAYALGREHELGVLQAGAAGDAVVLSKDPRETNALDAVEVAQTILAGDIVYDGARPG